jgi:filamentous hemagglutinin family protein
MMLMSFECGIMRVDRALLVLPLSLGTLLGFADRGIAQSVIVPDDTLGEERSVVVPNFLGQPIEAIGGGAQRGQNLFHSFREFNISNGRGAYFAIPNLDIRNVLTRVTGDNPSNILGTIGTFSPATGSVRVPVQNVNLFLINPNGIVFGRNARLNVGASFIATTASGLQLGDQGLFSASQPETSTLLSINPSAFLFNAIADQNLPEIVVRSNSLNPLGGLGLRVPNGQNFLLIGGDVTLESGIVQAFGGRVELGGLAEVGRVELAENGNEFRLQFPDGVQRSDVALINSPNSPLVAARVDVAEGGGGSITVNSRNLDVLGGSVLQAGIQSGLGTEGSQAGDITLNATGAFRLEGIGGAFNTVRVSAAGNAGNIIVDTGSLTNNGAQLNSSTLGQGSAGNVSITVRDAATFDGVGSRRFSSGARSTVELTAKGKGGTLSLSAGSLTVTNGAELTSSTFGKGDAGNVSITVRDTATFDGVGSNGRSSAAGSTVEPKAEGKGGTLSLSAGSLNVTNGAILTSSTLGQGDAGDVSITVRDAATFDGVGSNGRSSAAGSTVEPKAEGKGGRLFLSAGSLTVTNGAQLTSSTLGKGDAGDVSITVRDAATFDGVDSDGFSSLAGSTVQQTAQGKGGTLSLSAGSLTVTNGAQLTSSTLGKGDAGNVSITVRDAATFDGVGSNGALNGAGSTVERTAEGKGGTLSLSAGSLTVTNGAILTSSTLGRGDAGNVSITVRDTLQMTNGVIGTFALRSSGGSIDIAAKSMRLLNSNILTNVFSGAGTGGNITLTGESIIALGDSNILAFAADGQGGNITLNTRAFFGQNYRPAPFGTNPLTLIGNDRVDINASGRLSSGTIITPDTSFIQNNLSQLSTDNINPEQLIAKTCIVRQNDVQGRFAITGNTNLPNSPGTIAPSTYATATIQTTEPIAKSDRPWKLGDPIIEPTGFYRLADDRLVLGRECAANATPAP